MKAKDLFEAEHEDGKFAPSMSADPPHRIVGKNDEQTLFIQIYHPSHHANVIPAHQVKYNKQDDGSWGTVKDVPERKIRENGRVVLIGKRSGWPQQAARVWIDYENIDEVIEALKFAKEKMERDEA